VVAPDGTGQALQLLDPSTDGPAHVLLTGFEEIAAPAWSPDGRELAFGARRDNNWDLYVVRGDGSDLRRLTTHAAFDGWPAWSPDGGSLAFVSHRDGVLALYRLPLDGGEATAVRLSPGDGPVIEPAWSPDGRWLAYAAWADGAYRLEALRLDGGEPHILADSTDGRDLRAPAWSPDGDRLAWLELLHGEGRLVSQPWGAEPGALTGSASTHAAQASAFAWFPGGQALAAMAIGRFGRQLSLRPLGAFSSAATIDLPPGPAALGWTRAPLSAALPLAAPAPAMTASRTEIAPVTEAAQPGLVDLPDVAVPGARINAALAEDFAALRADLQAGTGRDFLGTLADAWRPLSFKSSGSAFFSWHKTGRAFDTQMELWGPGRRRDMVLVREDLGGWIQWRMFLRAAAQDGSVGRPLTEPGWTFSAGSGDEALMATGGRRGATVPAGYWLDFSALAARRGWQRIPSQVRGNLDWRRDWTGIEYWHYERRDGLRWYDAARQVYSHAELVDAMHPDRLRGLDLARLVRLGFPPAWPEEG
jgi:TolB protein